MLLPSYTLRTDLGHRLGYWCFINRSTAHYSFYRKLIYSNLTLKDPDATSTGVFETDLKNDRIIPES